MSRISFVEHRGKQIIVMDFSHLRPGDEFRDATDAVYTAVAEFSGRTFTTFTDCPSAMDGLVEP